MVNLILSIAYATSTKIKFFATIEDIEDGNNDIAREAALKALFVSYATVFLTLLTARRLTNKVFLLSITYLSISWMKANAHEYFVEYMLNPFSNVRTEKKILSPRFEMGIKELVKTFNENFGRKGMSWM